MAADALVCESPFIAIIGKHAADQPPQEQMGQSADEGPFAWCGTTESKVHKVG